MSRGNNDDYFDSLDSLGGEDEGLEENEFGNLGLDNEQEWTPEADGGSRINKKTCIAIIIIGILVIVIGIGAVKLIGNLSSKDDKTEANNQQQVVNSEQAQQESGQSAENTNGNVSNTEPQNVGQSTVVNMAGETSAEQSWSEIDGEASMVFTRIVSSFTVTDVRYYVKNTENADNKEIKAVVSGNISGLVGNYNLDVPYDKGQQLAIGNIFKISYDIAVYNDNKIISNITYNVVE